MNYAKMNMLHGLKVLGYQSILSNVCTLKQQDLLNELVNGGYAQKRTRGILTKREEHSITALGMQHLEMERRAITDIRSNIIYNINKLKTENPTPVSRKKIAEIVRDILGVHYKQRTAEEYHFVSTLLFTTDFDGLPLASISESMSPTMKVIKESVSGGVQRKAKARKRNYFREVTPYDDGDIFDNVFVWYLYWDLMSDGMIDFNFIAEEVEAYTEYQQEQEAQAQEAAVENVAEEVTASVGEPDTDNSSDMTQATRAAITEVGVTLEEVTSKPLNTRPTNLIQRTLYNMGAILLSCSFAKREALKCFRDHDAWIYEKYGGSYRAVYRESRLFFYVDEKDRSVGTDWFNFDGEMHYPLIPWFINPFHYHALVIKKKLLNNSKEAVEFRHIEREKRAWNKAEALLLREIPKRYTRDDMMTLTKYIAGDPLLNGKYDLKAFVHYVVRYSCTSIRELKVFLADFEMVPFLLTDESDTVVDFVSWRLEIGK